MTRACSGGIDTFGTCLRRRAASCRMLVWGRDAEPAYGRLTHTRRVVGDAR
jgi:hypothetical protein